MRKRNVFGKTREIGNAYAVCRAHGWEWEILKLYKSLENSKKDQYARAFCFVRGLADEYGDVYLREIPGAYEALEEAEAKLLKGEA